MQQTPELWEHQKKALERSKEIDDMAIFFDMGTGKTRLTLEILRNKCNSYKRILRTLIICPVSTMESTWINELAKYTKIPREKIFVLKGSADKRRILYEKAPEDSIFITNFESMAISNFAGSTYKKPPQILIIDESHRCKNQTARRTKALIKLSNIMKNNAVCHRYILTGTPSLNSELDMWAQFEILHQSEAFNGMNWFGFRATFFEDKNAFMARQRHFPNWQPRPGAREKIKKLIAPYCVTAKKEECLDLPPLLYKKVEVDLSAQQKKAYESMKNDFMAFVEDGVSSVNLAITKALRMQQILSGHLKLDDGSIRSFDDNPRLDALSDLLEDIAPSHKVIVWSIFSYDYSVIRKLCTKLGFKYAEVTGEVSDKLEQLAMFEKDPECRVMIASPSAGGTGVNMIEASYMIYYSRGYNLEHDLQSQARNYRGGSEKHSKITRIDLVAKGTVDDIVLKALREKKDLATSMTDLKNLLK